MTRAVERQRSKELDQEDDVWEHTEGESPDGATRQALSLAHRAAEKFPDLTSRYRVFAGTAAVVSGALIALASVAVARRAKRGQKPEQILEQITSEEIERAADTSRRHNRAWRLVQRIARRRYPSGDDKVDGSADEPGDAS
ncbi:MAG: hypothetical protein IIC89_01605 [Chloroflexi bacterium]|nr:hypothetical protein [Chloroflexota bacterium]